MTIGIGIGVHKKRRTSAVVPVLVSATIENSVRNAVDIIFSATLNPDIHPSQDSVVVKVNGTPISEELYDGLNVWETLLQPTFTESIADYGDVITVSYTQPLENPLQGLDGGLVESFVDFPVVNNIEFTPLALADKLLFWGKVSDIAEGELPNLVGEDALTVGGSEGTYTFQCPDTAPYIAADTDYIWFKTDETLRTTTEAELVGYDFPRTLVKYDNDTPYYIREIIILKSGETLTEAEENLLRDYMELSIWWDNVLSDHGNVKGNRGIGQNAWPVESVYEDESDALFTRMIALSEEPDATRKGIINTAIAKLKTDGIWAKLDALYLPASHAAGSARLNWISANYNLTNGVAPTFEADRGFTGNGTTKYLKTGFAPSAGGFNYTQDSASFGVYSLTPGDLADVVMGAAVTNGHSLLWPRFVSPDFKSYLKINGGVELNVACPSGNGLFTVVRDSSTTVKYYRQTTKTDLSSTSDGVTGEFYLLATNENGTASAFSARQISLAFIGAALTPTEQGLLFDALASGSEGYLHSIGAV